MLDRDLAEMYGVPTKRLNEQVRRNPKRFPPDFMFRLSKAEMEHWRSQFATSNPGASRPRLRVDRPGRPPANSSRPLKESEAVVAPAWISIGKVSGVHAICKYNFQIA